MEPSRERLRVVFDCMIFLQGAVRRNGPAGACLALAEQGIIELCSSPEILAEVKHLGRPRLRAKFPSLTEAVVAEFAEAIENMSTIYDDVPRELVFVRDPKDEPYLNLALRSRAHYLVSRDADILDLRADVDGIGMTLREKCPELQIVDPEVFLMAVRSRL